MLVGKRIIGVGDLRKNCRVVRFLLVDSF
ncbi:hypothetical protein AERO8C_170014 [Aeromonas veronii]|uniref:Uncharacterized protein n=1 Tax=Aeromonas veronii TaxID=654 RepID=A0A653KZQ0_AERVE|nr:hypothetical protein AERO8C_170014 [Aeromonas veronii]